MADLRGREIRESYKFLLSLEAVTSSRATGNSPAINTSAKFVTDGTGTRTALKLGTDSLGVGGISPRLEFTNVNPLFPNPLSANRTEFFRTNEQFGVRFIKTISTPIANSDEFNTTINISSNSMYTSFTVSGLVNNHFFYVSGVVAGIIDPVGTTVGSPQTIMTKEKADARYILSTNANDFDPNANTDFNGNNTFHGNNTFVGNNSFLGLNNFERTTTFNGAIIATSAVTFSERVLFNKPWDPATGEGSIFLNAGVGNRIEFGVAGVAAPTVATRSPGTKLLLYPQLGATTADYAIGVQSSRMWLSVPGADQSFRFYGGDDVALEIFGNGNLSTPGAITSTGSILTNGNATADRFLINLTDSALLPGVVWGDDQNTGIFSPSNDVIGFATGGQERVRVQNNLVRILGDGPVYQLYVSGAADSHIRTDIYRSDNQFGIRTVNSTSNTQSNDYYMTIGASGATLHEFRLEQQTAAVISEIGTGAGTANTIMTRQKGDARYPQLATANTYTNRQVYSDTGGRTTPTLEFTFKTAGVGSIGIYSVPTANNANQGEVLRFVVDGEVAGDLYEHSVVSAPSGVALMTRFKGDARYARINSDAKFNTVSFGSISSAHRFFDGVQNSVRGIAVEVSGTFAAIVQPAGTTSPSTTTVITREKGDARYRLKTEPSVQIYTSPATVWARGSLLQFTHGLGQLPDMVYTYWTAIVANEGFAVGEVIQLGSWTDGDGGEENGFTTSYDTTRVYVRISTDSTFAPIIISKASGAHVGLNPAQWRVSVKAIVF